ncbi:hypothetical protein IW262DRAFT_1469487 [Armillaria fumosa]|nr:hypothetical protein IW262DRAFT_1469487 [Armillaria fumosa]
MDPNQCWPQRHECTFTKLLNSPALDFPFNHTNAEAGASESHHSLSHAQWPFNNDGQSTATFTSSLSNWNTPQHSQLSFPQHSQSLSQMMPYQNTYQENAYSCLLPETSPRQTTGQENEYPGLRLLPATSRQSVLKSLEPLMTFCPHVPMSLQPSLQPVMTPSQPVTTSFPSVPTSCQSLTDPTLFIAYVPPANSKHPAARHKEQTKKMSTPVEIGLLAGLQDDINTSSLPVGLSRSMPTASASVQPCQQLEQSTGCSQEAQDDQNATLQVLNNDDDEDQAAIQPSP